MMMFPNAMQPMQPPSPVMNPPMPYSPTAATNVSPPQQFVASSNMPDQSNGDALVGNVNKVSDVDWTNEQGIPMNYNEKPLPDLATDRQDSKQTEQENSTKRLGGRNKRGRGRIRRG